MIWEPFVLAVGFGLVVSAGIYFTVMWPQVAPDDEADAAAEDQAAAAVAAAAEVAPGAGPDDALS